MFGWFRSGRSMPSLTLLLVVGFADAQVPGVPAAQTGMRATFYSSSATLRGTNQQAVLKPNCDPAVENCWVDPDTGNVIGQEDVPTAAGQGYTNVDILYLDSQTCVLRFTSYLLEYSTGMVTTAAEGGQVSAGDSCSDYWMSPELLGQMRSQESAGVRVLRGSYTLGEVTFDGITLVTSVSSGVVSSTYDAVTGLFVIGSGRTRGAAVPTISPDNSIAPGSGSSHLSYTRLLGTRILPGLGAVEELPAHVLQANRLVYQCSRTLTASGLGALETPCTFEAHLGQRSNIWALTNSVLRVPDQITGTYMTSESSSVIVGAGHGGFYATPTLLNVLQQGVTLDVDPVTGIRTSVAHVDDAVVAITEESNAERKTFVYDRRTGWLVRHVTEQFQATGAVTTWFGLVAVE